MMMKSKIPLPSKTSAQSSIPIPVKHLGTQNKKKLPLNPENRNVIKKAFFQPVSTKRIVLKPSKVEDKENNCVKRLPLTNILDTKTKAQKKPINIQNAKRINLENNKPKSETKVMKQTKPALLRQLPKTVVTTSKPVMAKENHLKRFSSYRPQKDQKIDSRTTNKSAIHPKPAPLRQLPKIVVTTSKPVKGKENHLKRPQNDKKIDSRTTNKSAIRPKIDNQMKKPTKTTTCSLKENKNKNLEVNENVELVVTTPIKQANLASGVDDSEFKDSHFFKSLILNQRELSPGIIKMCSKNANLNQQQMFSLNAKSADEFVEEVRRTSSKYYRDGNGRFVLRSPAMANLKQPQNFSLHMKSADEFVEEVKRTSAKYYRFNGRLVLYSPAKLKQMQMSADDFVEEVKRTSERLFPRKGESCLNTPSVQQNSCQKLVDLSVKENVKVNFLDEVRRLSEFRRQNLQNSRLLMANRRWTCNVSSKPSIANMSTAKRAAEMQSFSEIRQESGVQVFKNASTPFQKAFTDLELTAKKKFKPKKKVTFLIPSPGSPNLAEKTEAKLSDISEGSSEISTPELNLDVCKVKASSPSGDNVQISEDTSVITTPELDFTTCKLNFDSSPKQLNETLSFALPGKDNTSNNISSPKNPATSLEVRDNDCNIVLNTVTQCSQNSEANKSDILTSKFLSLQLNGNNEKVTDDVDCSSFENYLTNTNCKSNGELSKLKFTDCLFKPVNETEQFCVKTEKKIYTPHPVSLHSKSVMPSSVSPSFLSGKFSTLNSYAPICTPLVLKNLAHSPEEINSVRQRLDFSEKPNICFDRRESQIILQNIPTVQKINDFLCDQECMILSSQSLDEDVVFRNLINPIASTLNCGDEMHFIPICSP